MRNYSQSLKKVSFFLTTLKNILHVPVNVPSSVQYAITDDCNMNCKMCPIHHVGTKMEHADYDTFTRIVDRLDGVEEISLVGLGEPLMHPRIMDAIAYCKSKQFIVKTTTNGLLLNSDKKIKELILSGLDTISISIDAINNFPEGAHNAHRVVNHIERLVELKKELSTDIPRIVLQPIMFRNREADLYDIITWGATLGVHRVNVLRMHKYFDTDVVMDRPDRKEEKRIFTQLRILKKKYGIRVDCLQDQFFEGLKGLSYRYFKYFLRLDSFCTRLLNYPYISRDGDVMPCCVLPDYKFGNILESDLRDVWHNDKLKHFRKHHNSVLICSQCDNWRINQLV